MEFNIKNSGETEITIAIAKIEFYDDKDIERTGDDEISFYIDDFYNESTAITSFKKAEAIDFAIKILQLAQILKPAAP